MNCELLLYWMTQTVEGAWNGFRRSVEQLSGEDDDVGNLCRTLRISLSDLGYAEFFVGGSQKWKVLPAVLGGLALQTEVAVLCGARTPGLIEGLESVAGKFGCAVHRHPEELAPAFISVIGPRDTVSRVAAEASLPYVENLASSMFEMVEPIEGQLARAVEENPPINWKVRSFALRSMQWVDGLLARSACEFTPMYGHPVYFLHKRRGRLFRLGKREAVYASAMLQDFSLLSYSPASCELTTPLEAPLPESFARTACLCSGQLAEIKGGRLRYKNVPQDTAAALVIAAGQRYPWLEGATAERGRANGCSVPNI
jgi:hypothetical protein